MTNHSQKPFSQGWKFCIAESEAQTLEFDDSDWEQVDLPHDWAIAGPFSDEHNARTGGLPIAGTGWYRKHVEFSAEQAACQVSIEFDGAMRDAHVYVNGVLVGHRPNGYIGFQFDITPYLRFGETNVIAVRLQPTYLAERWYPGAGLYRDVRLCVRHPVHIPTWGVSVTTPAVSADGARIHVSTEVRSINGTTAILTTLIQDPGGAIVGRASSSADHGSHDQEIAVENPRLWDLDNPHCYTALSRLSIGDEVVAEETTTFGIRQIAFTRDDGFQLNGRRVQFQGVCMHHDLGPLGAAVNVRARERQMEIMKEMGVNAVRTSHNPPEPEWLEICDRMGIMVIVEAFDVWRMAKVKHDYHQYFDEWHERDLRDLIRRDRNHPSVILWSIGNEILEQEDKSGGPIAQRLVEICHDEDPTRLTTAGFNHGMGAFEHGLAQAVDVVGFNYHPGAYGEARERDPEVLIYGAETSSQTSSRGVYHLPVDGTLRRESGQVSSYDDLIGPVWTYPPDFEFRQHELHPHVMGEFIWTGIDYLGEPTPYGGKDNHTKGFWNDDWPSHSSYFAPVDLVGLPKDRFYLYQSQWTSKPMVHLLPHWNWKASETIPVYAYTNAESAELFLNGRSLGVRVKGVDCTRVPMSCWEYEGPTMESPYRLSWNVPFEPGCLKVVASTGGVVVAEKEINTAGAPAALHMKADRDRLQADGHDLSFITVSVLDADGLPCPHACDLVHFEVSGAGLNAGVGNGDPCCLMSFKGDCMPAFSGQLVLIVQSTDIPGNIQVIARADGLVAAELGLNTYAKNCAERVTKR